MVYILKHRAQHLLAWNNAPPHIRKPRHNRQLSPTMWRTKNWLWNYVKYNLINDFNDFRFEICSVGWKYILKVLWLVSSWNIRFVVSSRIYHFVNLIFVHIQKWVKRTISLLRHVSTCICLVQIILNWSRLFVAFEVLLLCCGFHYHSFYTVGIRFRRHSWCEYS